MAYLTINNVKICGIAAAVPKEVESVASSPCFAAGEAEKVIALTGVKERRIAPEGMVCSDYCIKAAEELITKLDWDKDTIDALIYVSVSRDYIEPNTATVIQGKLNLPISCYTIDVPMACSGYCYGLSVIGSLLSTGCMKRALFLVGDSPSKIMSPLDKTLWPLHGDAGTATALEYDENATPIHFNLLSDGTQYDAIIAPSSGVREPVCEESLQMVEIESGVIRNRTHVAMDGTSVFSFTMKRVAKCINSLCEQFGIDLQSVDYLLLHQANVYIDEKIRKKLNLPIEKVPYCLETYGNTSSATIPMTMVTKISHELQNNNNKMVLCGFGAGLSWASVYLETDHIVVLPLIEF